MEAQDGRYFFHEREFPLIFFVTGVVLGMSR